MAADFESVVLPHLHQAYNLARWLAGNDHDAEDLVQEAYLRAFRSYRHFQGSDVRPWLLKIVRNTCFSWSRQNRVRQDAQPDSDFISHDQERESPEVLAIQKRNCDLLRKALDALSPRHRELLILRELEEMSYREISDVVGLPIGTVMSGLARARHRLRRLLVTLTTG